MVTRKSTAARRAARKTAPRKSAPRKVSQKTQVRTDVIYDANNPPMLFDGMVRVYSTCRDCGLGMQVINPSEHSHPTCESKLTYVESLAAGFLSCLLNDDLASAKLTVKELRKIEAEKPDLHTAAVDYASWGFPVFPLREGCGITDCRRCTPKNPCGKTPAVPKARGGKGFKGATTDVAEVGKWWARHPYHNIGIATGHAFDVIDIDPRNGGMDSFMKLLQEKQFDDIHAIATTASGGMHLFIPPTGKGCFPSIRKGIDYKALGGYIVAAPSTLGLAGRSYSWLSVPSPVLKGGKIFDEEDTGVTFRKGRKLKEGK